MIAICTGRWLYNAGARHQIVKVRHDHGLTSEVWGRSKNPTHIKPIVAGTPKAILLPSAETPSWSSIHHHNHSGKRSPQQLPVCWPGNWQQWSSAFRQAAAWSLSAAHCKKIPSDLNLTGFFLPTLFCLHFRRELSGILFFVSLRLVF